MGNGEGVKWARHYYENGKECPSNRKKNIYEKTSELIINKSLNNKKTLFINIGSSSGLDLYTFTKTWWNGLFIIGY